MVEEKIREVLNQALKELGYEAGSVHLEHPADLSHGDYSTNVAMVLRKRSSKNPKELAEKIVRYIEQNKPKEIEEVEVAGAGFINFYLSRSFFTESVREILNQDRKWGSNEILKGKKVMIEYTDPNPFKEFHIGHLMSNAVGESISRLIEFSGAEVKRANYQGDVGLHVAMTVWYKKGERNCPWEQAYAKGYSIAKPFYRGDEILGDGAGVKKAIDTINMVIYNYSLGRRMNNSEEEIIELYKEGRDKSFDHFEKIYKKLGTAFDFSFLESNTGPIGKRVVEEGLKNKVFEKSEGAVVFRGEKYGLHTRVFLNSEGLPTYEAKELGLAQLKRDTYPHDISFVITASEITDYFKVVLKAMEFVFPELAKKTIHVSHGMLRLKAGKMSSRTGDVISAEALLDDVKEKVLEIMKDVDIENKNTAALQIAVGAVKYSILKQAAGKDIIFDFEKALSFEGDSGPYLQYSNTRALSVLKKAADEKLKPAVAEPVAEVTKLERFLYRFPEVVERAGKEYEPHYVTTYLTQLAGVFNSWYAKERIIDESVEAPYKLALTSAFQITIKNGLWLLGIKAPERM